MNSLRQLTLRNSLHFNHVNSEKGNLSQQKTQVQLVPELNASDRSAGRSIDRV